MFVQTFEDIMCADTGVLMGVQAYEEYFRYLDQTGGFFYERWGDAPVHSLGAVMLLNSSQVPRTVAQIKPSKKNRLLLF
jgi:hypothetical protein